MSGSWTNPNAPNLTDFSAWVYAYMQIPVADLPAGSQWLGFAFNQAVALVAYFPTVAPIEYVLAVYNCAGHLLLKITPDQAGQDLFCRARAGFKMLDPQIGIIQSSSDVTTGNSFVVPDAFKNMTIGDLQFYTTPYGREYLAYAQDSGPSIWGLT